MRREIVSAVALIGPCLFIQLLYYLKPEHHYLDLALSFLPQSIVFCLFYSTRFFWLKKYLTALGIAAISLVTAVIAHNPAPTPANFRPNLKILSANLFLGNKDYSDVQAAITRHKPDVLVFMENGYTFNDWFERKFGDKYKIHHISMGGTASFLLASNTRHIETKLFGSLQEPNYLFSEFEGFRLLSFHPFPPVMKEMYEARNKQLQSLASKTTPDTIIIGDFNVTPWSRYYREIPLYKPCGQSLFSGSWGPLLNESIDIPLASLMIDHAFLASNYKSVCQLLPLYGSDHSALLLRVELP